MLKDSFKQVLKSLVENEIIEEEDKKITEFKNKIKYYEKEKSILLQKKKNLQQNLNVNVDKN